MTGRGVPDERCEQRLNVDGVFTHRWWHHREVRTPPLRCQMLSWSAL